MKGPFFYRQENREIGPLSSHELKQHAATGELDPDDQVWTEDTPKGCTARKIKGLFPSSAVDDRGAESRPRAGPPPLPKISTPVPIAEQSHGTLGNAQRANWFRVAAGLLVATIGIWLGSRWLFPEGTGSQKSERTKDEKQVAKDTTKDTPQVTAEETTKEVWLDENDDWPRRRGVGKYVGDVAQGEFKFYDEYDRLMFVTSFKDGVEHGKFTAYYPSGAKLQEVNKVNGLMQGKRTAWHEDGALASTNDIVDGLTHGRQILYYHNGKEFVVNQYVRGVQEGQSIINLPDGRRCNECLYTNGQLVSDRVLIEPSAEEDKEMSRRLPNAQESKRLWQTPPAQNARANDGRAEKGPRSEAAVTAAAVTFEGQRYQVFTDVISWHAAREQCERLGGRLAIVTDRAQNEFLTRLVAEAGLKEAWLGATDEKVEGTWLWVDGSTMQYSHWNKGQPNNKHNNEHYLLIWAAQRGMWADQPDVSTDHKPGYVCQWK